MNLGGLPLGGFLGIVFQPLHVVPQRLDQIVGELAIALPGIAQQIEVAWAGFEPAQVVDRVIVDEAGVVGDVQLREAQARQQRFCDHVERRQRGALLALRDHHLIPEVSGILFDGRQFGQRVFAHQELFHSGAAGIVQGLFDPLLQTLAFGGERISDHGLQCAVSRPHDPATDQKSHQFS